MLRLSRVSKNRLAWAVPFQTSPLPFNSSGPAGGDCTYDTKRDIRLSALVYLDWCSLLCSLLCRLLLFALCVCYLQYNIYEPLPRRFVSAPFYRIAPISCCVTPRPGSICPPILCKYNISALSGTQCCSLYYETIFADDVTFFCAQPFVPQPCRRRNGPFCSFLD